MFASLLNLNSTGSQCLLSQCLFISIRSHTMALSLYLKEACFSGSIPAFEDTEVGTATEFNPKPFWVNRIRIPKRFFRWHLLHTWLQPRALQSSSPHSFQLASEAPRIVVCVAFILSAWKRQSSMESTAIFTVFIGAEEL